MIPRRAFINAFLELSSTLMATRLFSRSQQGQIQAQTQTATQADAQRLTNWSGNLTYSTDRVSYPRSAEDVVSLVKQHDRLKVLGTRHCFNTIADSPDHLISLKEMNSMRQYVFEDLPLSQATDHFDAIMSAGYSVSLFTDWQRDRINEVWIKSRVDSGSRGDGKPTELFGARPATKNLHPIAELSAEHCTEQLGVPGPWFERLPHFRMGFTPSSGKELQSEYFVPRQLAVEALLAIQRMGPRIGPHLFISEIRTIDADTLWMSPCYKQPSVALHFTWKQDWPAVSQLLPAIERELAPFKMRPHWGKLFTLSPAMLRSQYEKLDAFRKMAAEYDPRGKFQNAFLKQNVLA